MAEAYASSFIEAARRFVTVTTAEAPPSYETLVQALDDLAASVHRAPEGKPADGEKEPPVRCYTDLCANLRERFPSFGCYPVLDPVGELVDQTVGVADAIDDLADIVGDLSEVLWRVDTTGMEDAAWHFRFGYRTHWGRHLRELSLYLHAKLW